MFEHSVGGSDDCAGGDGEVGSFGRESDVGGVGSEYAIC